MTRVVVESPLAAPTVLDRELNILYARACVRDCFLRGEAPFASHLLYPQPGILDDGNAADREIGLAAGFAISRDFELTAVYTDLGISSGMERGIKEAERLERKVEYRTVEGWWMQKQRNPLLQRRRF